jgi:DNA-binding NtrC family response regulator
MADHKIKILVVDDDRQLADTLQAFITKLGYKAVVAYGGREGLDRFEREDFQLVITDLMMPEMNGIELLETIKEQDHRATVLVVTGYATIESAVDAIKKGAYDFIPKPFNMKELEVIIDRALERYSIFRQIRAFRRMFYSLLTVLIIILAMILMILLK